MQYLQWPLRRFFALADAAATRLYGWRSNPLYHSGTLVVVFFAILFITGVYLLFFYRIGAPYQSIVRITEQVWLGRWIRGLHRYSADAAVIAVAFHVLRMFAQGRSWGPRTLAWVSGVVLVSVTLLAGWTGFVMVWDVQAQVLAQTGARLMDLIPIFSEPISRTFSGELPLPGAFFFLNLFAHVALPIGLGILLWIHVSRLARPRLLPLPPLLWGSIGLLLALSILWPVSNTPPADLFALPARAPYDWFYSFWLPAARGLGTAGTWAVGIALFTAGVTVPWWSRPRLDRRLPPSEVDEHLCTGCEQCYLDCPYEAISMIDRPAAEVAQGRSAAVASVNPASCVSCGICAGSCAPMGVGPPGRTGRAQLETARTFLAMRRPRGQDAVIVACERSAGGVTKRGDLDGALILPMSCGGNLHTSVVEYLLRAGVGGVLVVSCPPRDCWNREGPKWLVQRLYYGREAELHSRVARLRLRIAQAGAAELWRVRADLRALRSHISTMEPAAAASDLDLERLCAIAELPPGTRP